MNTRVIQGKLHHSQKAVLEYDQLWASPQSLSKNTHTHHESHLHIMKVITILIPKFPRLPLAMPGTITVVLCTKYKPNKGLADYESRDY